MNEELKLNQKLYIKIFFLLIFLTFLTIIQPIIMNLNISSQFSIQLFFAFCKAYLIVAYYMHVKMDTKLIKISIYFSIAVLASTFIVFFSDVLYRFNNDLFVS